MTQTGLMMLMKAMGFDPQVVIAKAQELEQVFNKFGADVQTTVNGMDARMARMEAMIAEILNRQQQQSSRTQPAGESSPELHVPPALIAAAVEDEPQEKPNGRYTGNSAATKRARKTH